MKKLLGLFVIFLGTQAFAANYTDLALEVGFRQQNGTATGANLDGKSKIGYQLGMTAAFPVAEAWSIRTGLMYTERSIKVESSISTLSESAKFTYVDIPATVMYKFVDYAGAYAGVNLSMNLDNDCGSTKCTGVKSMITPFVVGAAFKFAPQLGGDVFFETMSGEVADNLKDFKAVGAHLMITFD